MHACAVVIFKTKTSFLLGDSDTDSRQLHFTVRMCLLDECHLILDASQSTTGVQIEQSRLWRLTLNENLLSIRTTSEIVK